jgi:hypothetical protein
MCTSNFICLTWIRYLVFGLCLKKMIDNITGSGNGMSNRTIKLNPVTNLKVGSGICYPHIFYLSNFSLWPPPVIVSVHWPPDTALTPLLLFSSYLYISIPTPFSGRNLLRKRKLNLIVANPSLLHHFLSLIILQNA